ncbi:MAG: hypothetical protein K0Q69_1 [Devosia sp.]|jgi:hypothetical protein|nr:hypothetical protein [Devosia sp.]
MQDNGCRAPILVMLYGYSAASSPLINSSA